jgi:hypothetical protein
VRWIWFVLVIGCGGARATGGTAAESGGFRIAYPDAAIAGKTGKRFYAKPTTQCTYDNGRDAHWAITGAHIETGELPPGVTIEDGAITGTPTKTGEFNARILVTGISCAGKSYPDEHVDVKLVVR